MHIARITFIFLIFIILTCIWITASAQDQLDVLNYELTIEPNIKEEQISGSVKINFNINPEINSIPVGLLYNMDTTGGNSGSPILDAKGRLIGVNFDRAYEATINDYAWNKDYSRSIGVDIRYVLWITQKLAGADFLLEEMGVESNAEKVVY